MENCPIINNQNIKELTYTLFPRIWLIAALSFKVYSAAIFGLCSFINNMKALSGFLTCGRFGSFACLPVIPGYPALNNSRKEICMKNWEY